MHIAYLVNQYPKTSHSFIRREIAGLEASGIRISRYSLRRANERIVDPADQAEDLKTQVILELGFVALLLHLVGIALKHPIGWLKALKTMVTLWFASDVSFLRYLAYLVEACVLFDWSCRDGVTHIHVHFGTNSTSVALLCSVLGGPPYSFTVHGPEEFDKPLALSLPIKIAQAKFVVAISSFGRSQLYRWCSYIHWSKIHVVHCGLDSGFLENNSTVEIPSRARFVCVARLSEQKGHLLLLQVVKKLAAKGLKFEVILVGDGELRPEIETLVTDWQLEDFVEITGWATGLAVRESILKSRAMVLPSFAEGLPVVIMESLALHRPVISTCIAGIPELVENDVCGWLIPAGSVDALAEAMTIVINMSPDVLKHMGQIGAERVSREHNADREARKLKTLFKTPTT